MLAQLIGVVGILFVILAYQVNKRGTMLRIQVLSSIAWTIHYMLLGAYNGASMTGLQALRSYIFVRYRHLEWVFPYTIAVLIIATALLWRDDRSLLPLIASIFSATALWQKDPRNIRLISLGVTPFWFSYNLSSLSYPGMIADFFTLSSLIIAIIRFDILPMIRQHRTRVLPALMEEDIQTTTI